MVPLPRSYYFLYYTFCLLNIRILAKVILLTTQYNKNRQIKRPEQKSSPIEVQLIKKSGGTRPKSKKRDHQRIRPVFSSLTDIILSQSYAINSKQSISNLISYPLLAYPLSCVGSILCS